MQEAGRQPGLLPGGPMFLRGAGSPAAVGHSRSRRSQPTQAAASAVLETDTQSPTTKKPISVKELERESQSYQDAADEWCEILS